MRFFNSVAGLMAMASAVFAQTADFNPIYTPTSWQSVRAGDSLDITWQAPDKYINEKISIHLIGGATQNTQVPLADIASGVANSDKHYTWHISNSLGDAAVYGIVMKLESNPEIFQYSFPFKIEGDGTKPSSSSSVSVSVSMTASMTASSSSTTTQGPKPTTTNGDGSVTVTTSIGTKIVTLTSCTSDAHPTIVKVPTTTLITVCNHCPGKNGTTTVVPAPNPNQPAPTAVPAPNPNQPAPTAVPAPNTNRPAPTAVPAPNPVRPAPTVPGGGSNSTVPVPAPPPTAGAVSNAAGSMAILGGIAMALLAF